MRLSRKSRRILVQAFAGIVAISAMIQVGAHQVIAASAPGNNVGLLDRQGIPFADSYLNWTESSYNAALSGFVMAGYNAPSGLGDPGGISWAELQPSAGSPQGTGAIDGTAIDHALTQVYDYNSTSPTHPWTAKLRIFGNDWAPGWAKSIDGAALSNGAMNYLKSLAWNSGSFPKN